MSDPLSGLLGSETEHRPARRPPPRRRPHPAVGFGRLLLAIIVMAGLVAAVIFGGKALIGNITKTNTTPDYAGSGTGTVEITIKSGQTVSQIATTLADKDVVKSAAAFRTAANKDPDRASKIQPGNYLLHKHMSGAAAFTLLFDPKARNEQKFTIAEGLDMRQALPIIAKATDATLADLTAAANNPAALGLPDWAISAGVQNAEGFLYPATYAPKRGTSAADILKSMVARFKQEADKLKLVQGAQAQGITPLQVVTLASIVEREVNQSADLGKAAAVMYNRLHNPAQFPTLGMDSTTRYAISLTMPPGTGDYTGTLTQSQLNIDSPYNTRIKPGIPPGPIGNPGEATLQAVLHPAAGDWTFFVYLPNEKETRFTASASEFQQLEAQYCQESGSC